MDITSNSDEMSYPKTESNIIFELKIENNGKDVSINYKEYGSLKKCTLKRKSS